MTRQTSIEAYNTIKENGLLSHVRWQVYDYLFKHGPATQRETTLALANKPECSGTYGPRFAELIERQAIMVVGKKINADTMMTVDLYDVTKNVPKKIKLTELQRLKQRRIKTREQLKKLDAKIRKLEFEKYKVKS